MLHRASTRKQGGVGLPIFNSIAHEIGNQLSNASSSQTPEIFPSVFTTIAPLEDSFDFVRYSFAKLVQTSFCRGHAHAFVHAAPNVIQQVIKDALDALATSKNSLKSRPERGIFAGNMQKGLCGSNDSSEGSAKFVAEYSKENVARLRRGRDKFHQRVGQCLVHRLIKRTYLSPEAGKRRGRIKPKFDDHGAKRPIFCRRLLEADPLPRVTPVSLRRNSGVSQLRTAWPFDFSARSRSV